MTDIADVQILPDEGVQTAEVLLGLTPVVLIETTAYDEESITFAVTATGGPENNVDVGQFLLYVGDMILRQEEEVDE